MTGRASPAARRRPAAFPAASPSDPATRSGTPGRSSQRTREVFTEPRTSHRHGFRLLLCRVPTEWQYAQAWILDNGDDELGALGGRDDTLRFLHAHGFERLAVKLQDGQTEINQGLVAELNRRAGELGLPVRAGGWSQNREQAHD